MKIRMAVLLIIFFFLFGAVGFLWQSQRPILLSLAFVCLIVGYLVEKLGFRKEPFDLSIMKTERVDWTTISVPNGTLAISDKWNLFGGLRLKEIPPQLKVVIYFFTDRDYRVVKSITLLGNRESDLKGMDTVVVDTGLLYFGDADIFADGLTEKMLASMIDSAFDNLSDETLFQLIVRDSRGTNRGIVLATGIGDGEYEVSWGNSEGCWQLHAVFLTNE